MLYLKCPTISHQNCANVCSDGLLSPQFAEHGERAHFGKVGQVELVVGQTDLEDTVALLAVEVEEVHGGEVHAHKLQDGGRLVGLQEVAMERRHGTERGGAQVEVAAWAVVVEVGIEAQEAAKAHEEDEVEVGEMVGCAVKPEHGRTHIGIERHVLLFALERLIEKLGREERDGQFGRIGVHRRVGRRNGGVGEFLQFKPWPYVGFNIY